MMDGFRILWMVIAMTALPAAIGMIFWPVEEDGARLPFCWVAGRMLLWAGFQLICVPAVLTGQSFRRMEKGFLGYVAALVVLSGLLTVCRRLGAAKNGERAKKPRPRAAGGSRAGILLWAAFALLLGIQLFLLCFLSYEEGDDSYYVAVATYNKDTDRMYTENPYTGDSTELDVRHALAPFPIWISVLSALFGLSTAATAHVAAPLALVLTTYGLYYLFGKRLLRQAEGDWQMPLFLCFAALLVLFGGYSVYSAENFLLVRTAQGKSALANLVIPFVIYLMLLLAEKLECRRRAGALFWILTGAVLAAGCLCSTLGSLLLCILLGACALCVGVTYRRWGVLFGALLCMAAPAAFAFLYVTM